jgi:hypothetical protein
MPDDSDGGDPGTDVGTTVRAQHDWSGSESVGITILEALEESTGGDARSFGTLNDVVDTDALDSLFRSLQDGSERGPGYVTLEFEGHTITVHSDGEVVVARQDL